MINIFNLRNSAIATIFQHYFVGWFIYTKSIHGQNQVSNLKRDECNPKSNVQKSAQQKSSIVELDMDVSKSKSSASNTATKTTKLTASHTATKTAITIATKAATMADGPFILTKNAMIVTQKVMSENQLGGS